MSLFKQLRRRRELRLHLPEVLKIQLEMSEYFGGGVSLAPFDAKGGYDEIYYATLAGECFAVVRINSGFKVQNDPIGLWDAGIPLGPKERLNLEWSAYQKMFPLGLSPEPLWRNEKSIACSWVDWERASRRLARDHKSFWMIAENILLAVNQMHRCGVMHLDLNLGNVLVNPKGCDVLIIDFEFGAADWVTQSQQRAFDYLRLINDFAKKRRGGDVFLSDIGRVILLLDSLVDSQDRSAELSFVFHKLKHLSAQPSLVSSLQRIFPNLVLGG